MIEEIIIDIDIFRSRIFIYITDDYKACNDYVLKKRKVKLDIDNEDTFMGRAFNFGLLLIVIKKEYLKINIIVHELYHAINMILRDNRDSLSTSDTEEIYAYMLDYCVNTFLKKYNKKHNDTFLLKDLIE